MDQLAPASFVLRASRRGIFTISALVVVALFTAGCGSHRRSSMRPVIVSPARSAAPCTNCGTQGTTTITPSVEPALTSPSVSATPSVPLIDDATTPAGGSPPRPASPSDEPILEKAPSADPAPTSRSSPSGGTNNGTSPGLGTGPTLQGPKSSSSLQDGQRTPSGRVRQASLRSRLEPLVNDPDDLFTPPKADKPWKYIVLHHSARNSGNLDDIDHEHRAAHRWDGCGYHFVIGNGTGSPDGKIEVAARWAEQKHGIHCRNGKHPEMSEYGIGICLVGDFDQSPPTRKQIASAQTLIAYLSARYHIPATRIDSHEHLAATPTACPGKHFPSQAILGAGATNLVRQ